MIEIKLMQHDTRHEVEQMLREYIAHGVATIYKTMTVNDACVEEAFSNAVDDEESYVFIAVRDGVVTGVLWARVVQPFWSNDYFMEDVVFYVKPQYRNKREPFLLLKRLEHTAQVLDIDVIQLAGLNGPGGVNDVYRKRFTEIGSVFHNTGVRNG